MSAVLRLADKTELALSETPQQATTFADGQSRIGIFFKVVASDTVTAESVNSLVSNPQETTTWSIVNDGTVAGTYSNYTILAAGVTLSGGNLAFTLCKMNDMEVQQNSQQMQIDALTLATLGVK